MSARPPRSPWSFPSVRDAAALLVLGVALASLAGAAWVHAEVGRAASPRRGASPSNPAALPECSPSITSMTAASAPAAGGVPLTIHGLNFTIDGPPSVLFGSASAPVQSAGPTEIVVLVPPQADNADPSVTVVTETGRTSPPSSFEYDAPSVDAAPDANATYGHGTVLTITGSNFRCAFPRAWLEDASGAQAPCDILRATDTEMVVGLPDYPSPAATLRLGIVHRDIAARNVLLDGPQLSGVSPSSWPAHGGTVITITGSNFAAGGPSRVLLEADGRGEELPIVSQTDNEIVAVTPDSRVSNAIQVKKVTVRGWDPEKKSVSIPVSPNATAAADWLSQSGVRAGGGTKITIVGGNFRAGAGVNVGGVVVPGTVLDETHLVFDSPALAPGLTTVHVEQDGTVSPALELQAFDAPAVLTVSPSSVPAQGGTIITIEGLNFGGGEHGMSRVAEVRQGPASSGQQQTFSSISNVLKMVAPPGSPGAAELAVTIDGVEVTLPDAFAYSAPESPTAPLLDSAEPLGLTRLGGNVITLHGANFDSDGSGSALVNFGSHDVQPLSVTDVQIQFVQPPLPAGLVTNPIYVEKGNKGSNPLYEAARAPSVTSTTGGTPSFAGGIPLTIYGTDFEAGARVRFGAADGATRERAALRVTPTSLEVIAPEVEGHEWNEFRVVVAGLESVPQPYFMEGPHITGLSTRELSSGGGTHLTITGTNFGASAPSVQIGDVIYPAVQFNPTEVTIDKPAPWKKPTSSSAETATRVIRADGAVSDSMRARWKAPEIDAIRPSSARAGGGTKVTISGTNFGPEMRVMLDGATGAQFPPTADMADDHMVVTLEHSGPGEFIVTVPGAEPSDPVVLERLAPPVVQNVGPASVPLAGGVLITIEGANFGAAEGFTSREVCIGVLGCPRRLTSASGNSMTFMAPPGSPGPVDLVVTIDGVADTVPAAFTYSSTADAGPPPAAPRTLALRAGPTPFRGELGLAFALPTAGPWTIDVFDASGARVRRFEGDSPGALYEVRWDGRSASGAVAPPGVYFARLTAAGGQRIARAVKLE